MRAVLIATALGLSLGCMATAALAQCEDKSQQNTADEAAVRGELKAGSKCADSNDTLRSQQKNEDAAARAKQKTDGTSGTTGQGGHKEPGEPSPQTKSPQP